MKRHSVSLFTCEKLAISNWFLHHYSDGDNVVLIDCNVAGVHTPTEKQSINYCNCTTVTALLIGPPKNFCEYVTHPNKIIAMFSLKKHKKPAHFF